MSSNIFSPVKIIKSLSSEYYIVGQIDKITIYKYVLRSSHIFMLLCDPGEDRENIICLSLVPGHQCPEQNVNQ